jgi:NodT family efflux transporter outer membrane factor (OMF) lipoprotein
VKHLLAFLVLLSGCTVGPDYKRPEVETPAAYREAGRWQTAQPRDGADRGKWWAAFNDPQLDGLMAQMEVSNQTIAAAEAQVRVSAALAGQARASWWPALNLDVRRTESRPSRSSGSFESTSGSRRTLNSLTFSATWEADLWGRIRRLVESGDASTRASAADLLNARLSAQAELAQSYFQLRALDSQKRLLEETVAAFEKTLELTKNRYAQGVVSRADVAQAETQLATTRAQALDTTVQRSQLEHAIAVLLGKPAPAFALARGELAASPPALPGAGVPADLLERRPDIAAAERRVEAANAQIGVARAAFFPTATIGGSFGYQAASSAAWFTSPARFWSLGPALALTLFDAGRRQAVTDQRMAEYDQTVAQYRNTVLIAWREVEDNLAALRILEEEARIVEEAVRAAQQSLDITLNQYKAGIVTFLQVVTAQTALLSNQRSALDIRSRRIVASVLLVRALGGGWQ